MSSEWYDDRHNLSAVARYMGERGDTVEDVAYMLEKPWKFVDDWQRCADVRGGLRAEASRASARLALVPPHARAVHTGGVEGCDCTELCDMGPTCPGGILARLPGSGCARMAARGGALADSGRACAICNSNDRACRPHDSPPVINCPGEECATCDYRASEAECATCSGRGVWMDEPCGDCRA